MPNAVTASMLYDLVQCPKRVEHDLFSDPRLRDPVSPFVEMLWRRGTIYETEVMESGGLAALDLSRAESAEKQGLTLEAMRRGEPLIYGGRISSDDLLGVPDCGFRRCRHAIPRSCRHAFRADPATLGGAFRRF